MYCCPFIRLLRPARDAPQVSQSKMTPRGSRRGRGVLPPKENPPIMAGQSCELITPSPFFHEGGSSIHKGGVSDLQQGNLPLLTVAGQCWTGGIFAASPNFPHSALCIRATSAPLRVQDIRFLQISIAEAMRQCQRMRHGFCFAAIVAPPVSPVAGQVG
jgi:hypothetical protein